MDFRERSEELKKKIVADPDSGTLKREIAQAADIASRLPAGSKQQAMWQKKVEKLKKSHAKLEKSKQKNK